MLPANQGKHRNHWLREGCLFLTEKLLDVGHLGIHISGLFDGLLKLFSQVGAVSDFVQKKEKYWLGLIVALACNSSMMSSLTGIRVLPK